MASYNWFKVYDFEEDGADIHPLNTVRTIDVKGKLICLAHIATGYYAVDDRCPHAAGGRLGRGKCDEEGRVVCPVHRYKYDLTTGRGAQGDYVETYPVEVRNNGVYIGMPRKSWWPF
ncbi:MAG TPA: Rieske 2Fe-2S domain-containing protein [Bacteroidia bacterium]|nr:Rieske 2Fe-2S domain-containing protein [Bacteroidia bacterium]